MSADILLFRPRQPPAQVAIDRVYPGRPLDTLADDPLAIAAILASSDGAQAARDEQAYARIVTAFREFQAAVLNAGAHAQLRFSAIHGAEATRYGPLSGSAERMWEDAERYRWLKAQSAETLGRVLIRRRLEDRRLDALIDEKRCQRRRPAKAGADASRSG